MRAFLVLVSCLAAATGTAARVAAATNAKAAAAAVFLPPPDQVDLMKQVTDAQLDGERRNSCPSSCLGCNSTASTPTPAVCWEGGGGNKH